MEVSCLQFVAYDPDVHTDFITVRGGTGCSSAVGRRGNGEQFINLAPNTIEVGCFRLYTIVHEFLHALGFYHMQSAYDRDDWVQIVSENIQPGTENNFNKYTNAQVTHYGVDYDYGSCMHYSAFGFSINGEPTIVPLRPTNETMGQRVRISEKDISRLNRRYCGESTAIPTTVTLSTTDSTTELPTTTTRRPPIQIPRLPELASTINSFVNNLINNIFGSFRP